MNSMKKFGRTRSKTTVQGARFLTKLDLHKNHPMFIAEESKEATNLLERISKYKPEKSYMELKKIKDGVSTNSDRVLGIISRMKLKEAKSALNNERQADELKKKTMFAEKQKNMARRRARKTA
jgi:hypothetical protein